MCEHPFLLASNYILQQTQFEEVWRKFQTYSGGEDLFGMPVTPYPDVTRIRKELNLLQKLYSLYNAVMDSVDGYFDILWVEVGLLHTAMIGELIVSMSVCVLMIRIG